MKRILCGLACMVMALEPARAWNYAGHRAITFLAYSHLNDKARKRVDEILRAHPDYTTVLSNGLSQQPWDIARNAFVTASTWPDLIRNDPRFSDVPGAPVPAGFPSASRHQDWHYTNTGYPAEFASVPVPAVNAISQLPVLLKALKRSGPVSMQEAYALPWLLHIITDLHQPLHAVSRYRRVNGKPEHDRGGNGCYLTDNRNLHSYWDGVLGRDDSESSVARLAISIGDETPKPARQIVDPTDWVAEAMALAPTHVYSFPESCDDKIAPAKLSADYEAKAVRVARQRAALAAYRLAAILNDRLGR
ncbi:MAG TPA: S1/P1 nuclease [Bryobacteraceae bacterium]|nr:S1/P1 nuclease [Bryobacteraceae bacterium]